MIKVALISYALFALLVSSEIRKDFHRSLLIIFQYNVPKPLAAVFTKISQAFWYEQVPKVCCRGRSAGRSRYKHDVNGSSIININYI